MKIIYLFIFHFSIHKLYFTIINWGLGIGDWGFGMGIGDWAQSPIPNPQSPIPNPHLKKNFKNIHNLSKKNNKKIQINIIYIFQL
jgi:hypothetical protein